MSNKTKYTVKESKTAPGFYEVVLGKQVVGKHKKQKVAEQRANQYNRAEEIKAEVAARYSVGVPTDQPAK